MAEIPGETLAVRSATSRRVLDPVSRASEALFGLIMVLTFTLSLAATEGPGPMCGRCSSACWGAIWLGPPSMPSCT